MPQARWVGIRARLQVRRTEPFDALTPGSDQAIKAGRPVTLIGISDHNLQRIISNTRM
ncbi:hypothetical protein BDW72DRAFT_185041 [Aspergillus terricola var. indicus]